MDNKETTELVSLDYVNDSIIPYFEQDSSNEALKTIISEVAAILGHTPAICQKCYIFPDITKWKTAELDIWIKRRAKLIPDKDKLLLRWLEAHIIQP